MACSQGPTAELLAKTEHKREVSGAEPLRALGEVCCDELSFIHLLILQILDWCPVTVGDLMDLANPIYIVSNTQHHTGHFKLSVPFVKSIN